jgi:cytosine/uracil/thiamine/allantoin permease
MDRVEGARRKESPHLPLVPWLLRWLGLVAMLLASYLGPAWRVDVPAAWALFGIYAVFPLAFGLAFRGRDPDMLQERSKPGRGVRTWDRAWLSVYGAFFFILFVVAGFDVRFCGPHTVPPALQVAGLVLFAAGLSLGWWATSVNTFFSRIKQIKMDEEDKVGLVLRNLEFDRYVQDFLTRYPEAVVVHIG